VQKSVSKEEPSLKFTFFAVSVRKNQSRFECRPIRKQYFEILIDFYAQGR
jgi:hypothetical protein